MRLLIWNATVVFPEAVDERSVVIERGRIADVDPAPQLHVDEARDAASLHLLPGLIDDQVHYRQPGQR